MNQPVQLLVQLSQSTSDHFLSSHFACHPVVMPACLMQEARQLFSVVCAKLDALAHSSLAAKPVVTDLEIKVNAPAVTMEDAAPVTMSAAGMQAPEEVHAKVRAHRAAKRVCVWAIQLRASHLVLAALPWVLAPATSSQMPGAVQLTSNAA